MLRDVYGNTYTYARLGSVAASHPVAKEKTVAPADVRRELDLPGKDPVPTAPASAGMQGAKGVALPEVTDKLGAPSELVEAGSVAKERLFANPARPEAFKAGGEDQLLNTGAPLTEDDSFKTYFTQRFGLKREDVVLQEAQGRLEGHRRDRSSAASARSPRPSRPTCSSRSVPPVAARRASTPSRSSTAGSCWSPPPSTAPPARTRSSGPTPRTRRSARSC